MTPKAVAVLPKCAAKIAKAATSKAGRFAINCVRLVVTDGEPTIEATDGRMLVRATFTDDGFERKHDADHRSTGDGEALIPARDFAAAITSGKPTRKEPTHVEIHDDGTVRFVGPRWTVVIPAPAVSRGAYPNTKDVIPAPSACKGAAPGKALGWKPEVSGKALLIAGEVVGDDANAKSYPNGSGPLLVQVRGEYGEASVVFMPTTATEAEEKKEEVAVA